MREYPDITARQWWGELAYMVADLQLPPLQAHYPGQLLRCLFAPLGDVRAQHEADSVLAAPEELRDGVIEPIVADLVRALTDARLHHGGAL